VELFPKDFRQRTSGWVVQVKPFFLNRSRPICRNLARFSGTHRKYSEIVRLQERSQGDRSTKARVTNTPVDSVAVAEVVDSR